MSEYSYVNLTKTKKSPILRVQIKKAQKIVNSNSTKNIKRNNLQLEVPKTFRRNESVYPMKKLYIRNNFNRSNSITSFNRYRRRDSMDEEEKEKYINYINLKKGKLKYIKNIKDI